MPRDAAAVAASLTRVPPFPPVAAKLLTLLSYPSVDLAEVAELIGSDATFTARLLQRVNSVEFGLRTPVTAVKQAVALLGIDLTRNIIVTHATASFAAGALGVEELRRCWQHTVATAVLAEEIAEACNEFTQIAFTAGIMHDIGRLGLLVAYPQDYERIIRNAAERCLDLLDFEHEEFGLDHAEAGRMLAERWGLPVEMATIAGRHHDPCEGTELSLLRVVHVACRLADTLGFDVVKPLQAESLETALEELPAGARERLRGDPAQFRTRIEQRISEYDSSSSGTSPEETLALLAPAVTEEAVTGAEEALAPELLPSESPEPRERASLAKHWPIIAGLVVAAVVLAALVIWRVY
jgi:putative nucleotidyltransferase with HDIG domain